MALHHHSPAHGFQGTRRAGWGLILLALLAALGMSLFVNRVVFPGDWLAPLSRSTAGLIQPTLVVNLVGLGITIAIMAGIGRLRVRDLGLRREDVLPGIGSTVAYWLVLQLVLVVVGLALGGTSLNPDWGARSVAELAGSLIAQLFGNALHEEVLFRGLLMVQLFLLLAASDRSDRSAMAWAIVLVSVYFALTHVPSVLRHDYALAFELPRLFIAGITFALLYVYSGNLLFVVGVHGVGNWNMPLIETGADEGMVAYLFRLGVVVAWSFYILLAHRGTAKLPEKSTTAS